MNRVHPIRDRRRTGFTRTELVATLVAAALLVAVILPLVGAGRSRSRELGSLRNLAVLAGAHAAYAADWGDRQFTNMPDNMAQSGGIYFDYLQQFGCPPSVVLGFGNQYPPSGSPGLWGYWMPCFWVGGPANFTVLWPMQLGTVGSTEVGFGMAMLPNVVGFNEYVNGRFMDPVFFAPADDVRLGRAGPGLSSPDPFTLIGPSVLRSSYILSPAAMFHPGVFGGDEDGEFKSPYDFELSSVSPTVSQCAHPDLKSRMIEEGWLQSPPTTAVPSGLPEFPPYFNWGADSVPMTLFFDGHAAELPIRKVLADNAAVVKGGGAELWMDTDITVGPWSGYEGYYSSSALDDTRTSVHVFTRRGILGRDQVTTGP